MSFSRTLRGLSEAGTVSPRHRLVGALLCLMRRGVGVHPDERALRIEERLMLGGKKSVTLLVCHGRRFLLAASGDVLTPMGEVLPLNGVSPSHCDDRLPAPREEIFP